jgi:hypothetical protein
VRVCVAHGFLGFCCHLLLHILLFLSERPELSSAQHYPSIKSSAVGSGVKYFPLIFRMSADNRQKECCPAEAAPFLAEDKNYACRGKMIHFEDGDAAVDAYVVGSGKRCLLFVHDIFGLPTGHNKKLCDMMAAKLEDTVIIAPDFFPGGVVFGNADPTGMCSHYTLVGLRLQSLCMNLCRLLGCHEKHPVGPLHLQTELLCAQQWMEGLRGPNLQCHDNLRDQGARSHCIWTYWILLGHVHERQG